MKQKTLWKIEELWQANDTPLSKTSYDVAQNYNEQGMSQYYARFHYVQHFDFTPSAEAVFTDDYGTYHGLRQCQVTKINGKLVYLFDNHNEMLYPLVEVCEAGGRSYDILHIDAHPDDALFQGEKKDVLSMESVGDYIPHTRISDFFDAISEYQGIGEILRICRSQDVANFTVPEQPYILSLDIDIFGLEGDFVALEQKVSVIKQAWNRADVVCIAMSPGFIDQTFAQGIIEIMTRK